MSCRSRENKDYIDITRMKNLVTMAEKYDIYVGDQKVHSSITEDEMLDITQDFADEFYQVGTPHPDDVRVEYLGYDIEDE